MAEIDEDIWPRPCVTPKLPANFSARIGFAEFLANDRVAFQDVLKEIYEDTNGQYGTDVKPPN